MSRLLDDYLFGEAGRQINDFIWTELCDWYIEAAKVRLRGSEAERQQVAQVLAFTMERSLRLLHPFMPFVTERLWQEMPHAGKSIMIAPWPSPGHGDPESEQTFETLMEVVRGIRTARADSGVEPGKWIAADVYAGPLRPHFEAARAEFGSLARIADDQLRLPAGEAPGLPQSLTVLAGPVVALLPRAAMIDLAAARARLAKELDDAMRERARAEAQLGNESFMARAPEKVVQVQRDRLKRAIEQSDTLRNRLADLGA